MAGLMLGVWAWVGHSPSFAELKEAATGYTAGSISASVVRTALFGLTKTGLLGTQVTAEGW